MIMNKKIYFAGSIRGGRVDAGLWRIRLNRQVNYNLPDVMAGHGDGIECYRHIYSQFGLK